MGNKVRNIYRYKVIKEYGLENSLYLTESTGQKNEFSDKAKNITYRAISYFENSGNKDAAQEFSKKSNSIWTSSNIFEIKLLKICRLLVQLGIEPDSLNQILGQERCDGTLYYMAYKNGKPKLFAHSLYNSRQGGTLNGKIHAQAKLSGLNGSERATSFSITSDGLEFIKKYEGGFQAKAYSDTNGKSIGYGHFIKDTDPEWLKNKYYGGTITQEQALEIMAYDVQKIAAAVEKQFKKHITGPLSQASGYPQAFIDMVISIAYNAGAGGMSRSSMFMALTTAPYDESTKMINLDYLRNKVLPLFPMSCNKGLPGVIKRRKAEEEYVVQRAFKA